MTAVRARFCLFLLYWSISLSTICTLYNCTCKDSAISAVCLICDNEHNALYCGTFYNNIIPHIAYFLVMGYFLLLHALPRYIWSVTTGGYCQSRHISYSNKAGQPRIFWSLRPTLCQTLPNVCFLSKSKCFRLATIVQSAQNQISSLSMSKDSQSNSFICNPSNLLPLKPYISVLIS